MHHILVTYLGLSAIAGVILFFTRIRHLPLINQVTCLTVCSILLPPTSYDYTLLHLYAPWAMLILLGVDLAHRSAPLRHRAVLSFMLGCYAFLLTPQSEFIFHGERFGGQVKALVLLALLYASLRYPLEALPVSSTTTPSLGEPNLSTAVL